MWLMIVAFACSFLSARSAPTGQQDTKCVENYFQCASGNCIPKIFVCDGEVDCEHDGSDEASCDVPRGCAHGEYACASGKCIPVSFVCDGQIDCVGDGSDEASCDVPRGCTKNEYACASGKCIPKSFVCDGHVDCEGDGSDETSCVVPRGCAKSEYACASGKCIPKSFVCDGHVDCEGDGSDEAFCDVPRGCAKSEYACASGKCIPKSFVCDGHVDCEGDGSDEASCVVPRGCAESEHACASGKCIPRSFVCDGHVDCVGDGSDEASCGVPRGCAKGEYACGSGKCIPKSFVCDGHIDCVGDGSDEASCDVPTSCTKSEYACASGKCIPKSFVCDGHVDCEGDGSDEAFCDVPRGCSKSEYACADGQCVPFQLVCDGRADCSDGSDEGRKCTTKLCGPQEFRCKIGSCIPSTLHCDGTKHCSDNSDEENCPETLAILNTPARHVNIPVLPLVTCSAEDFQCKSGNCIPKYYHCDGVQDCHDNSDEEQCPRKDNGRKEQEENTKFNEISSNTSDSNVFHCKSGNNIPNAWRCDGTKDCPDNSDEQNCPKKVSEAIKYAINTEVRGISSNVRDPNDFQCKSGSYIKQAWRCDGVRDCSDNSDEENCPKKDVEAGKNGENKDIHDRSSYTPDPNDFQCKSGNYIKIGWRCDGVRDCFDNSDEENCPKKDKPQPVDKHTEIHSRSSNTCKAEEFHCKSGNCISKNRHCDGTKDCLDNSDEENCPKNDKTQSNYDRSSSTKDPNGFLCKSGIYIPRSWYCDGTNDCIDNSDEENCPRNTTKPGNREGNTEIHDSSWTTPEPNKFRCKTGKYIPIAWHCDGTKDCLDNSDEENCPRKDNEPVNHERNAEIQSITSNSCSTDEFQCKSGYCIPNAFYCDGNKDCLDNSDEENCASNENEPVNHGHNAEIKSITSNTCNTEEFQCKSGDCIPKSYHCDGTKDCIDNSDEESCPRKDNGPEKSDKSTQTSGASLSTCSSEEFQCKSGTCILNVHHCDGIKDCLDNSDEENCSRKDNSPGKNTETSGGSLSKCSSEEFKCKSGTCIHNSFRCDGIKDCLDNSDEENCPTNYNGPEKHEKSTDTSDGSLSTCSSEEFQCKSGTCILNIHHCDGIKDCLDNSDEENCSRKDNESEKREKGTENSDGSLSTCSSEEFQCKSGICIPKASYCDGIRDCHDNSDEENCSRKELEPEKKDGNSENHGNSSYSCICNTEDFICISRSVT